VAQVVESLPSKCEALSLKPGATKKKRKRKKEIKEKTELTNIIYRKWKNKPIF
jgi:hypothetical protein